MLHTASKLLFLPGASGNIQFWQLVADLLIHPAQKTHIGWPSFGATPADPRVTGFGDLVAQSQSMGGIVPCWQRWSGLSCGRQVVWQIAAQLSSYRKHGKRSLLYCVKRRIEKVKAQMRAKVEHPFRVIKWQFGYTKVRFRGLVKNTTQLVTLFALSNLWVARRHLLANTGEVRL